MYIHESLMVQMVIHIHFDKNEDILPLNDLSLTKKLD